jgi:hypothetical protein
LIQIPLSRIQMERISKTLGYHADQVDSADSVAEACRRLDELRAEVRPWGLNL